VRLHRRGLLDEAQLDIGDVDDVSRLQERLLDGDVVDFDAVLAPEIADEDARGRLHELGVMPRHRRVARAHLALRVPADRQRADQEDVALTGAVLDNELSASTHVSVPRSRPQPAALP
jgi:hypothetical protein